MVSHCRNWAYRLGLNADVNQTSLVSDKHKLARLSGNPMKQILAKLRFRSEHPISRAHSLWLTGTGSKLPYFTADLININPTAKLRKTLPNLYRWYDLQVAIEEDDDKFWGWCLIFIFDSDIHRPNLVPFIVYQFHVELFQHQIQVLLLI